MTKKKVKVQIVNKFTELLSLHNNDIQNSEIDAEQNLQNFIDKKYVRLQ